MTGYSLWVCGSDSTHLVTTDCCHLMDNVRNRPHDNLGVRIPIITKAN